MKAAIFHIDVVGLMSGTSLDGLDLCCVAFDFDGKWHYRILKAESVDYPAELRAKLANAQNMTALEYARLHSDYGLYLGGQVRDFLMRNQLKVDLIASHGQTIFHQPSVRFTAQIGSGAGIAAVTGIDTVCDFRTTDVALGGQGAPLVPIGDAILFSEYDACLNLGGFSNISFAEGTKRLAYDISPVNYVLNHYAGKRGLSFDKDGNLARSGRVDRTLLDRLNGLPFYTQSGPKSLGREWVESEVYPLIESAALPVEDVLATFVEHVAMQIARHVRHGKVLVTGGGARNIFLLERMQACAPQVRYVVPDALTIDFKEALIFALLGALFMANRPNCLASVTGAAHDNIGGCLYKA
ncbi:MAG: anhydro-N-acetylmuramic acid kinase [Bacteroidales bacterium]|nr:anhydro-N-acetylmuramic acid kinase [Bacteroidales bacterium]